MVALIISGGDYSPLPDLSYDYVIACDRGYLHARRMDIRPDLILGDFDSAPVPNADIPVERHPAQKDDTDTMLAVKKALETGCQEVMIACAFGGRLDHTLANIQAAAYAADHGASARLCGTGSEAWVFRNRTICFPRKPGFSFSVFSITDTSSVTITGAEYACTDLLIRNTFPIGISNEWKADRITVTGNHGIIMVMESRIRSFLRQAGS